MGYVRSGYVDPDALEGFWSTVGGGLRKAGQFAVKATTGVSIGNGAAAPAPVLSDRGGTVTTPEPSFLDRLRARAMERLSQDPDFRRTAVDATARIPGSVLTAAQIQQARGAPTLMKASIILPALAVGAMLLRRR